MRGRQLTRGSWVPKGNRVREAGSVPHGPRFFVPAFPSSGGTPVSPVRQALDGWTRAWAHARAVPAHAGVEQVKR
ncbi:hypothetical protein GCM10010421_51390 [Streptomyces glaucus]|uniref:Secreted protein n=1 Tax=Streptomyces glaucus TaxID=284029 RepID=A0ABP5XCN8_9ACTN